MYKLSTVSKKSTKYSVSKQKGFTREEKGLQTCKRDHGEPWASPQEQEESYFSEGKTRRGRGSKEEGGEGQIQ